MASRGLAMTAARLRQRGGHLAWRSGARLRGRGRLRDHRVGDLPARFRGPAATSDATASASAAPRPPSRRSCASARAGRRADRLRRRARSRSSARCRSNISATSYRSRSTASSSRPDAARGRGRSTSLMRSRRASIETSGLRRAGRVIDLSARTRFVGRRLQRRGDLDRQGRRSGARRSCATISLRTSSASRLRPARAAAVLGARPPDTGSRA